MAFSASCWLILVCASISLIAPIAGKYVATLASSIITFLAYIYYTLAADFLRIDASVQWLHGNFRRIVLAKWKDIAILAVLSDVFNLITINLPNAYGYNLYDHVPLMLAYFYVYAALFWFTPYLVACRGESWLSAIKLSFRGAVQNTVPMIFLLVLSLIASMVGFMVVLVGVFFVVPVIIMTANTGGRAIYTDAYL